MQRGNVVELRKKRLLSTESGFQKDASAVDASVAHPPRCSNRHEAQLKRGDEEMSES
jgi:hypothetical protein